MAARNMYSIEINVHEKLCVKLIIYKEKRPVIIRWNPASSTNRFTQRESATGIHLERGFVGRRFSLDSAVKKGISCL